MEWKSEMERAKGFEPSTFTLARWRATSVLRPHYLTRYSELP